MMKNIAKFVTDALKSNDELKMKWIILNINIYNSEKIKDSSNLDFLKIWIGRAVKILTL